MGKGSKDRVKDKKSFEETYDKIFGDTPQKSKKGIYVWDEDKMKLVHEDDYVPKNPKYSEVPTALFMGGGFPTKDIEMSERKRKGLEKDLFFTSLNAKQKQLSKRSEENNKYMEEFRDKLPTKGKQKFDQQRKQTEKLVEKMKKHPGRKKLFDQL